MIIIPMSHPSIGSSVIIFIMYNQSCFEKDGVKKLIGVFQYTIPYLLRRKSTFTIKLLQWKLWRKFVESRPTETNKYIYTIQLSLYNLA